MDIHEAVIHALRGNSLLFTGAGFSYGAKNSLPPPDNQVPNARQFAARLADALGTKGNYELPIISQYFLRKEGKERLISELIRYFSITSVVKQHISLSRVNWRRVYTTNYDNCFEFAALQNGSEWRPLTVEAALTAAANRCVHINGHVHSLTTESLLTQVKLTHSSYSADAFASSPWAQQFRQDINSANSIFFVGYSLADLDISRILFNVPDLLHRTHFIVGPGEDDVAVSPLEDYGTVHRIGIDGLASLLDSTVIPPDTTSFEYSWLTRYPDAAPVQPDDKSGIELLTMGTIEPSHVAWSLPEPQRALLVRRSEVDEILSEIDRGRTWFLVHSDLGNGKTILKHELSYLLTKKGYAVFWDSALDFRRKEDLHHLKFESGKVALFIDESPERFGVIDGLLTVNVPNVVVVICVRTTLYELGEARYNQYLPDEYLPVDINYLNNADVSAFVGMLTRLGIWGPRADMSEVDKENFVKVECGRHVARLILSVFEDSEIGRRITEASKRIVNQRDDVSSVIILSFLLNRMEMVPRITIMSEVLNKDVRRIVLSEGFQRAGEFIRFSDGVIKGRSSIISTHLLRKSLKAENLVWHMERFERRLSSLKRNDTLNHMFTQMQRFPLVEGIIDSPRKREIIIGYFQSIKDLPYCVKNAQFWLHYAMARASFGEFKEASLYFESARSFAKDSPKDTTDVNNQFAKMLLDSRTNSDEYSDYGDAFALAHKILIEQMVRKTNKHFPFRQAARYAEFISYRGTRLTAQERAAFGTSCKQVLRAIANLDGALSRSQDVARCRWAMERSMEILKESGDASVAVQQP